MTTAAERDILRKAREITRAKNRERRQAIQAERRQRGKADRGRVRDNGHLAFVRRLPCAACQHPGPCDPAHLRLADAARGKSYTGKGVKPDDRWTTPLCRPCHERQHGGSEAAFWSALGIDPISLCEALYAVSGDYDAAVRAIRGGRG